MNKTILPFNMFSIDTLLGGKSVDGMKQHRHCGHGVHLFPTWRAAARGGGGGWGDNNASVSDQISDVGPRGQCSGNISWEAGARPGH